MPDGLTALLADAPSRLDIALQPIVRIDSGELHGYEALTRQADQLGFASVHALFDAAAKSGGIEALSAIVQAKAIAKFVRFRRGRELLYLNLDGRLFDADGAFFEITAAQLQESGLALADLRFEFSEMYQGPASDDFFARLQSWRESGAIFAIDDFGQGYSGLRVLYELRPEILKLDRFFISGVEADRAKRKIVSAVASLARELGVVVLAEGVETGAELRLCGELGCELAQGYFVSPPLLSLSESATKNLKNL